jgi:general secretion pathway protein K
VWLAIRDLVQPEGPGRWRTDGEARTLKFDDGTAVVVLQDESGKIDLNAADVGLIYSLLLSATGDGNAALSMLQAILDWRDADGGKRKSGAEVEEYAAEALAYGPRNGPFTAVDELRLVMGMNEDLYSRLSPALTVYSGDSGLNPEVAVREALLGLPDMTPQSVDEYLVDRTAATQEFDQRFLSSTRRRVVTIVSQGEVGENRFRLEVVVRIRPGGKDLYSLMSWRESGAVQSSRTQAGGA